MKSRVVTIIVGGEFGKFHAAFISAIDIWIHLDEEGDGVLILSNLESTLLKLKIQDMVSMEKLRALDPNNVRHLS